MYVGHDGTFLFAGVPKVPAVLTNGSERGKDYNDHRRESRSCLFSFLVLGRQYVGRLLLTHLLAEVRMRAGTSGVMPLVGQGSVATVPKP